MPPRLDSPLALLLVTGTLLGLAPPLGKAGIAAGVPPLGWALLISAGTAAVLTAILAARGTPPRLDRARAIYATVTAALSYAIPNALMFLAIPHLGAGYAGIMLTLSPVTTLCFSILCRVRRPTGLGVAGIAVGFVGAVVVASTRGELGRPADPLWVAAGLAMPLFLAAGNVYRSLGWPAGATPTELAAGSHVAAAAMLLVALVVAGDAGGLVRLADVPGLALAQVAASAAMFACFFRLQVAGGPVYLSQIGYVGAVVGLLGGIVFLGEHYGPATLAGAVVIAAGVAMTTLAQRRAAG